MAVSFHGDLRGLHDHWSTLLSHRRLRIEKEMHADTELTWRIERLLQRIGRQRLAGRGGRESGVLTAAEACKRILHSPKVPGTKIAWDGTLLTAEAIATWQWR